MTEERRQTMAFRKKDALDGVVDEVVRDGERSIEDFMETVQIAASADTEYTDGAKQFLEMTEHGKTTVVTADTFKGAEVMIFAITMHEGNKRFVAVVLNPQFYLALETNNDEMRVHEVESVLQFAEAIVEANKGNQKAGLEQMDVARFHDLMMNTNPPQYTLLAIENRELTELRGLSV